MKKLLIALALLMPTVAWAAKPSMLCKNLTSGALYTVVVVGTQGEILFQIDAGQYMDGTGTKLENKFMGFYVKTDQGAIYMVVDPVVSDGRVKFENNDGSVWESQIHCIAR
jgi:hypothetical protein